MHVSCLPWIEIVSDMLHQDKVTPCSSELGRRTQYSGEVQCQVLYQYIQNMWIQMNKYVCTMSCDQTQLNTSSTVQEHINFSSYTCLQLTLTWCHWCILYTSELGRRTQYSGEVQCQVLYQYIQNMWIQMNKYVCTMSCDQTQLNTSSTVQEHINFSSYTCLQLTLTWCHWCILYVLHK